MWAAIDDDVHSDVRKTIDASRRQRYIIQENRVSFMKIIMPIVLAMAIVNNNDNKKTVASGMLVTEKNE